MVFAPIFVALNLNHIPYILRLQTFKVVCYIDFYRSSKLIHYISCIYHSLKCQSQGEDKPCLVENQGILVVGWTIADSMGAVFHHCLAQSAIRSTTNSPQQLPGRATTSRHVSKFSVGAKELRNSVTAVGEGLARMTRYISARPRLTYPRPHPRVAASLLPTVRPRSACGA